VVCRAAKPPNFGGKLLYSPRIGGLGGYRPVAEAILAACLSSNEEQKNRTACGTAVRLYILNCFALLLLIQMQQGAGQVGL